MALLVAARSVSLPPTVRVAVDTGPNYLSALVYWEVLLKSMKGHLDVGDPRTWWLDTIDQLAATALPLRPEHVAAIHGLPPIHKDPFDRALIAQAMVERLDLVTTDAHIPRYASSHFRVVS